MKQEFKVITGSDKEVQKKLDDLCLTNSIFVNGISTTNETITIIVEILQPTSN